MKFHIKPHIASFTEGYVAGKPIEEVKREYGLTGEVIKLASNENPLGPSPLAIKAMEKAIRRVNYYPISDAFYLVRKLSEFHKLPEACFIPTGAGEELLHMLSHVFIDRGDEVVIPQLTFPIFKITSRYMDAKIVLVPNRPDSGFDIEGLVKAITPETHFVFLANPNNPTGSYFTREEADFLMDNVPEKTVVLFDCAYHEYVRAADYADGMKYIQEGRNVVQLRTFSKAYGLAGLRVGYGIAAPEIARELWKVKPVFSPSLVAQEAALAALDDVDYVKEVVRLNAESLEYYYQAFDGMGLKYYKSQCNFVYVEFDKPAGDVFTDMIRKGVIIRPILPNTARISTGTMAQNERCVEVLKETL